MRTYILLIGTDKRQDEMEVLGRQILRQVKSFAIFVYMLVSV